ncbi:MAG: ATP-binding cassette domain-containing protein [Clostridiales bacterium]|nr:ATP-binding cassette domain-containing protein [Clostridiales bacterium]
MILAAEGVNHAYGGQRVLEQVSLVVQSGETLAIVGRSGCGKTTLLRILAGFIKPDGGAVTLDGSPVDAPDKDRWMVFQSFDQLFPWFTLRRNLTFALRKTRPWISGREARVIAGECLAQMGLEDAGDKYPYQLSGGMQQRGALARAMAVAPKALLMDEPFSSLDVLSRESARGALATLAAATGAAVVIVTHDLEEAAALGTRIALMKAETRGIFAMVENQGPDVGERLRRLMGD